MTNDLEFRKSLHLNAGDETFVGKYKAYRLVYYEQFQWVRSAIAREKEIKAWRRSKKDALIRSVNPGWKDLSADWGRPFPLLHVSGSVTETQGLSRQNQGARDDKV
jgi:putative endonuclease